MSHADTMLKLINEICLDLLECPLQSLIDHREHEEKQQVSSLFLQLYDTFNALVVELTNEKQSSQEWHRIAELHREDTQVAIAERDAFKKESDSLLRCLETTEAERDEATKTLIFEREESNRLYHEVLAEKAKMQKRLDFHFGHAVESWRQEVEMAEEEREAAEARVAVLEKALAALELALRDEPYTDWSKATNFARIPARAALRSSAASEEDK